MSTEEIIIRLFVMIDDRMSNVKKRSDALLHPSEIITIGCLFALKGGRYRAFYRWLTANYRVFFPNLPEVSRLHRLLRDYSAFTDDFLAKPTFFTILDSYGIELLHPRREGRSTAQIGQKGISNGRWIVGVKVAWLINSAGQVVTWSWDTASAPDNIFRFLATQYQEETITLCDFGFREAEVPDYNLKFCPRGTWNDRFTVETDFSWVTELFHAKKMYHRVKDHLAARLGYMAVLINCLLTLTDVPRSLVQFGI